MQNLYFRYKYFPNWRSGVSGFGQAPASRRQEPGGDGEAANREGGRHMWGGGQRLGGN